VTGLLWLLIAVFAALSCLFAACTSALRTFNHIRLEEEFTRRGRAAADQMKPVLDGLGRLILSTATLRMLFNILVILMLAHTFDGLADRNRGLFLAVTGTAAFAVILVFSVAIPNAWAKYSGEPLLVLMLPTLRVLNVLLSPITAVLHGLDELVRRLTGAPPVRDDLEHVERQIMSVVSEGEREGVVDPQEKRMIESVLQFQDTRADQIMTPRTDIIAVDVASDLATALETIHRAGHSRIPVYEGNMDNIIGLLYTKDLLWELARGQGPVSTDPSPVTSEAKDDRPAEPAARPPTLDTGQALLDIRKVMRPPLFVPESRPVSDLLNDLRRTKVHLAVVLDEFGGTAGLVTIEDILEEIVGEIADEHEQPEPSLIRPVGHGAWDIDGRAHVDDVNEQLKLFGGLPLAENDDYDTISGLVISTLGRIPKTGEKIVLGNVTITVAQAEPRRINRLRVQIAPPGPAGGD